MRATHRLERGSADARRADAAFRRLAVFVGGCTLEVAETVCAAPEGAAPLELDLLDGLSALVDHSLVQQREEGGEAALRHAARHS